MIDAWFDAVDKECLPPSRPRRIAAMKIRERIRLAGHVPSRSDAAAREALRRALAILAQPQNLRRGARLGWRAADRMWRDRRRHRDRLQPLQQTRDPGRRLRLDQPGLSRRRKRGPRRTPRLPRPPHRRRHALREGEGELARQRASACPRSAASSAGCAIPQPEPRSNAIDNQSQPR